MHMVFFVHQILTQILKRTMSKNVQSYVKVSPTSITSMSVSGIIGMNMSWRS